MSVPAELRRIVWQRAGDRCEYCQMLQTHDPATFEIDHVVPEKLDGQTVEQNLALACFKCNNHKNPNIAGIDSETSEKAFLFDPRADSWSEHFVWQGPILVGRTPIGRATIAVLQINASHRVSHRRQLMTEGVFPIL